MSEESVADQRPSSSSSAGDDATHTEGSSTGQATTRMSSSVPVPLDSPANAYSGGGPDSESSTVSRDTARDSDGGSPVSRLLAASGGVVDGGASSSFETLTTMATTATTTPSRLAIAPIHVAGLSRHRRFSCPVCPVSLTPDQHRAQNAALEREPFAALHARYADLELDDRHEVATKGSPETASDVIVSAVAAGRLLAAPATG